MWRARQTAGEAGLAPLRTLQKAFARELSPGERAATRHGVEGRRQHEVYLRWEPAARNARWETDHKELPVLITPPVGARPCKPWVTLFVDAFSRLIMGWAMALHPNAATVLAGLHTALLVEGEGKPFGGVPQVLVPDGGLEFATTALERACATVGIRLAPTPPYSPLLTG
jgi:putative transposase